MAIAPTYKSTAYIYLIDELKHYYDDLLAAYNKPEKYHMTAYTSEHRFFGDLEKDPPPLKAPRILIFVVNRHLKSEDPIHDVLRLLDHLYELSPGFEVILITSQEIEKTDPRLEERGVVALIPDNENALLRIDNLIKGSISRHTIRVKRKAAYKSVRFLGFYLLLLVLLVIIARILFPEYF